MNKKVFVTGSTGFIGGSIARELCDRGYSVTGLVRDESKAKDLEDSGIKPLLGTLSDIDVLKMGAQESDIIVNAASSDNRGAVEAILSAITGSGKMFIQNSGSTVVSEKGIGAILEKVFDEDTSYKPEPAKQARVDLDQFVLDSAKNGVHSFVVCPCLIYGEGLGMKKESAQIPALVNQAIKSGIARYIGEGSNIWSSIHIKDLVKLYLFLIENQPQPGTFYFAENGEIDFKSIAQAIQNNLHLEGSAHSWTVQEAVQEWGEGMAQFALASNSRIRAKRARELGWAPEHKNVLEDVARTCRNLSNSVRV